MESWFYEPTNRDDIISSIQEHGIISLEKYNTALADKLIDTELLDMSMKQINRDLIAIGAHEISKNIYVLPTAKTDRDIMNTVKTIYEDIKSDFKLIKKILSVSRVKVDYKRLEKELWFENLRNHNGYVGYIMMALCEMGCFHEDQKEEVIEILADSDFRKEMQYLDKYLHGARPKVVKNEYEKYRSEGLIE